MRCRGGLCTRMRHPERPALQQVQGEGATAHASAGRPAGCTRRRCRQHHLNRREGKGKGRCSRYRSSHSGCPAALRARCCRSCSESRRRWRTTQQHSSACSSSTCWACSAKRSGAALRLGFQCWLARSWMLMAAVLMLAALAAPWPMGCQHPQRSLPKPVKP